MPTPTQSQPPAKHPFPFSVGFPLVIREQPESLAICGANHGEGWPILCEVPKDTHHKKDADSIRKACTAYLNHAAMVEALDEADTDLTARMKATNHNSPEFNPLFELVGRIRSALALAKS